MPLVARTKERGSGWERKLTATTAQNVRLVVTLTEAGRSLRYTQSLTKTHPQSDSPAFRIKKSSIRKKRRLDGIACGMGGFERTHLAGIVWLVGLAMKSKGERVWRMGGRALSQVWGSD